MHTIYCFNNGGPARFLSAVALGDDGICIAGHCCSDEGFMPHDLGITSDWKHELYDAHFGAGNWKLEWVADPASHAGLNAAIALAEANHEAAAVEA